MRERASWRASWENGSPKDLRARTYGSEVAVGEHGDQELLVVPTGPFPGRREDGGTEGVAVADPGDRELQLPHGEPEAPAVEPVSLLLGMLL